MMAGVCAAFFIPAILSLLKSKRVIDFHACFTVIYS